MIHHNPKNLVPKFFDETSGTYDKVVSWTTFGKDKFWKNTIVNQIRNAKSVLDLACGTGILTRMIADRFPESHIVGIDITKSYLQIAQKNSTKYPNISYILQDAEKLSLNEKFDCICSSYIPKYCNPKILIHNCKSHLNSDGRIIFHDFTYPKNIIVRKLWKIYFQLLNCVAMIIPSWKPAFKELPELIKFSNWIEEYKGELIKNEFDVEVKYFTLNSSAIIIAKSKRN